MPHEPWPVGLFHRPTGFLPFPASPNTDGNQTKLNRNGAVPQGAAPYGFGANSPQKNAVTSSTNPPIPKPNPRSQNRFRRVSTAMADTPMAI
jgi:hypothetical protein